MVIDQQRTTIMPLGGVPCEVDFADQRRIIGEVTGIHLRDDCLRDGRFDVTAFHPVARLGYRDYTIVREVITLDRPDD